MSRDLIIAQQKKEMQRRQALEEEVRAWVDRLGESHGRERANLADKAGEAILALVKQGASVDTAVVRRDGAGKALGMVSVASALLGSWRTAPYAAQLFGGGARFDQDAIVALAGTTMRVSPHHSLPPWLDHVIARALNTPGLDWDVLIEDTQLGFGLVRMDVRGSSGRGRPIRLRKAIGRIKPGFTSDLMKMQRLRGERCELPPLPCSMTPKQSTWMLYEIVSDGRGVEKLDRGEVLQRSRELMAIGADPLMRQEKRLPTHERSCAMDLVCRNNDAQLLEVMLSGEARPTKRQVEMAVRGALERNRARFSSALGPPDEDEIKSTAKELFAVLALLDEHGVVDLDEHVQWRTGLPGLAERYCRHTMREAFTNHLPPLLPMLVAHQEARLLRQNTPEAFQTSPPRARL